MTAPRLSVTDIAFFERDVVLRLPFRFGVITLREAPQAFVRVRIRCEDGREAEGAAAELIGPKWFDKDPALSNEENIDQLRASCALAAVSSCSKNVYARVKTVTLSGSLGSTTNLTGIVFASPGPSACAVKQKHSVLLK